MAESFTKSADPVTWFNQWLKSAGDIWSPALQPGQTESATPTSEAGDSGHAQTWIDTQFGVWQSLASAMSRPDTLSAYLQGISRLPESLTALILPALTSAAEMHQKGMGQAGKAYDFLASFNFENPDKHALDLWRNLYDQEFRKFLNIPQLGLTRQYQEKTNQLMDRFHVLQTAMAEFLHLLYRPFETARAEYLKKLAENTDKNEVPADFKAQYMIWLKILEGHYMVLFQTPEYLASLGKTISAAAAYSLARKSLTNDLLKSLSITSLDNIEGIYRELYDMKKRLKDLEKTIQTLIQR
jgi:hypothetical protein